MTATHLPQALDLIATKKVRDHSKSPLMHTAAGLCERITTCVFQTNSTDGIWLRGALSHRLYASLLCAFSMLHPSRPVPSPHQSYSCAKDGALLITYDESKISMCTQELQKQGVLWSCPSWADTPLHASTVWIPHMCTHASSGHICLVLPWSCRLLTKSYTFHPLQEAIFMKNSSTSANSGL